MRAAVQNFQEPMEAFRIRNHKLFNMIQKSRTDKAEMWPVADLPEVGNRGLLCFQTQW